MFTIIWHTTNKERLKGVPDEWMNMVISLLLSLKELVGQQLSL
jgi:hypothetical protein